MQRPLQIDSPFNQVFAGGGGVPSWLLGTDVGVDVDFMNDRSWFGNKESNAFARLLFARSTQASYYDVNGVLQFASANVPRIEYDPITHAKLGYLSEQSATNYCLHSNDFTQVAWGKTNVTVTPNAAIGPDGTMSMSKIEATAAAATQFAQTCIGAGTAAGNTYSVHVKKGSGATDANIFILRNNTTATNLVNVTFNYDTGVFGGADAAKAFAQALPNGLWRISLISTTGINANDDLRVYAGFSGNVETAGEFLYVYGVQTERPIGATSYFPTTGAAITRANDDCRLATSAFAFDATQGTLLGRYRTNQQPMTAGTVNCGAGLYLDGDVAADERCNLYIYSQTPATHRHGSNGRIAGAGSQWDIGIASPPNAFSKCGVAYRANDIGVSLNGAAAQTDVSATLPNVNRLGFGRGLFQSQFLNGHVDRITYWPYRKTNAQLQALTA